MNVVRLRLPLVLSFLLLFVGVVTAQPPGGGRPGGGGRPAIGRIYGRVLDESTKAGAEFATVSVLAANKDTILGGALVQTNGDFSVERLPFGPLRVRIAFMGYKTLEKPVVITPDKMEQDLGNLMLEPDEVVLKEAEVTREKATQVLQVDRRTYNVEKDMSVKGGNASDVMKNIPGLTVDVDGNVEMRGKNPQVMVDGRPTTMTLDQIPADDIDRVEVITNPSVIFDASATGGIVNVVLKKSTKPGYNGQLQAGAGSYGRMNGSASLQVKEGRTSVTLSYNINHSESPSSGFTDRTDLLDGEPLDYFAQDTKGTNTRTMHNGRVGLDYRLSNRNTITFAQSVNIGDMGTNEDQGFDNFDAAHVHSSSGDQHNDQSSTFTNLTSQVGFKRTTTKPGKEWTTDLTFNLGDRDTRSSFQRHEYDPEGLLLPPGTTSQVSTGNGDDQRWTWQADVVDPYKADRKLEWGFKASLGRSTSFMDVDNLNDTLPAAVRDTSLSNAYKVTDIVNAAYINWSTRLNTHWTMQAGLRVEQTWFSAERTDKAQEYDYRYPDGFNDLGKALFPAVYFSRKWDAEEGSVPRELQVNISRKINRPNFYQVMPFIMFTDARSYRIGNPALAPEMSTIAEVNHLLPFNGGNWLTSLFARYTEDVITNYAYPLPSDPNVLVTSFINGTGNWGYGWENTIKLTPWTGTELTLNGNVQWITIGLTENGRNITNQGVNWNGKANLTQRFPKGFSLQVNANYEGPRPVPQGHTLEQYSVDGTVGKDFSKRFTVTAGVNDIFNTRSFGTAYGTPFFTQEISRRRDMRNFRVTATWKFGQPDASLFRRRQQQQQQRRDPGATNGDQEGY